MALAADTLEPGRISTGDYYALLPGGLRLRITANTASTHLGRRRRHQLVDEFADPRRAVLVDPIHDVPVRGEQVQPAAVLDGLQWTDPGVEGLFRKLRLEPAETLMPERNLHDRRAFRQGR